MSKRLTVMEQNSPIYDICIEPNFQNLCSEYEKLYPIKKRVLIVSDSNVSNYYQEEVIQYFSHNTSLIEVFVFLAGEESKKLSVVQQIYERLITLRFDRSDLLIALGGGVVGDLTGFVAATYLRGISFIQIPTSLLAMVDSSIGGKTAVDFLNYKNMVGAFHQPKLVYINLETLKTLPDREFYSGLAEVIKHGFIKDKLYYEWIKEHIEDILAKKIDVLTKLIEQSCKIKKAVVEKDPKEQGERALLNFGHTIGHAIEKLMDFQLLHGECVSIGMAAAIYLSKKRGYLSEKQMQDAICTLKKFHLPVSINCLKKEQIVQVTKNDKKMSSGNIKFILLEEIGNAVMDTAITEEEMLEAISYIQNLY